MPSVIEILDKAISDAVDEEYGEKKKTSFWASETDKMAFDIYHCWKGTPKTDPITEEKLLMLKMRKLTEEAIVSFLRRSGRLVETLTNKERTFFEWGPNKVPISGYSDAGIVLDEGADPAIIEIKTYYGTKQHSEIRVGKVRVGYLQQLAIYLFHRKMKHGILLMVNQGTGEKFEFDLWQHPERGEGHYICPDNEIEFDLLETFRRWETIYVENILKDIEPAIEYVYKRDIEKIDWNAVSADAIRKARGNHAVIGDWQCKYSDYKTLIAERQGTTLGYTEAELKRIRELTTGYSQKRAGSVKFDPNEL